MRRIFKFTQLQIDKLNKVKQVLNELEKYKPLTLRQVYYQLVGKGYIENIKSQYGMLSRLLKYARIEGYIDWQDIEDRVRVFNNLTGFNNKEEFIKQEERLFLTGYSRNLLQNQNAYIECWIEKDALSSIFIKVARNYSVPVVVCRGFTSASFLNDFKNRLTYQNGKTFIMLYFGDFDPSGMEMLKAMQATLESEMGVYNVQFKRVALTKNDIIQYKLPYNPDAIKQLDTRTKKYQLEHGNLAVELDALTPGVLEDKIKAAIEAEIDTNLYYKEVNKLEIDLLDLSNLKQKITEITLKNG